MVDTQTKVKREFIEWARIHNEAIRPRKPGDPFTYREASYDDFHGTMVPPDLAAVGRELSDFCDLVPMRGSTELAASLDKHGIPYAITPIEAFRFAEDRTSDDTH